MSPCVCVVRSMKVPSGSVQCDGSVPSLSLTTHKYQQPGTPRHTDTGAETRRHSFYLDTPFSAHDFPAPCPVLPIFAAFRFEPHSKYLGCPLCGERVAPPVTRLQDTFITPTTWPRQAARHVATRGDTGHVEINPDQISL